MTLVLVSILAALIGASMGLSGLGGFLIVPTVMIVLGASPIQAVFTALLANLGVTAIAGLMAVLRHEVAWRAVSSMALGSLLGAVAAAWLVQVLPTTTVRVLIAGFLAVIGVRTLLPGRTTTRSVGVMWQRLGLVITGAFAQVSAVLVGVGGPAVTVPTLLAQRFSARYVVGTALVHGAIVSCLGVLATRQAGAGFDGTVALVASVTILASMLAANFRANILGVIDLRLVVGVLALSGSLSLLLVR